MVVGVYEKKTNKNVMISRTQFSERRAARRASRRLDGLQTLQGGSMLATNSSDYIVCVLEM